MNSIKELAYKMFSDSQRMYVNNKEPHSFFDGYREVMFNGKIVKYDAIACYVGYVFFKNGVA